MANNSFFIFIALASSIMLGCGHKKSPEEYVKWFKTADAQIIKDIDDYRLILIPLTPEYIALRATGAKVVGKKQFNEQLKNYTGLSYFLFRIGNKGSGNSAMYSNKEGYEEFAYKFDYMTFGAQEDYKLIKGRDTLDCVLYNFENSFNLTPNNDILLAFKDNNASSKKDFIFQWNDRILGVGTVNIKVNNDLINSIPQLDIE